MKTVPQIESVAVVGPTQLLATFRDGSRRIYDCQPLLSRPEFQLLGNPALFRAVRVDSGGYGVSWNDRIDISEYELWTNGAPVAEQAPCHGPPLDA